MLAWRRVAARRTVLVNLRSGNALRGVLWATPAPLLVLRGTSLLEPGRDPVGLDGEVIVERTNVDFVQVLAPNGQVGG